MEHVVSVEHLTLNIGKKSIYQDVTFALEKGTITVLCGQNGAGKSRLLRTIKGLQKATSGSILIHGKVRKEKERLLEVALVFQDADLQIVGETVYKDCAFGPENLGLAKEEIQKRCDAVLSTMGLMGKKEQRASTLSGGEKRRLAIAGVLAMEPDVILLDEPFANLDYPSTLTVIQAILDLKKLGHTILIVSHEVEKFLAHADNCLVMEEGKLLYDGEARNAIPSLIKANIFVPSLPFEELTWLRQ